MAYIGGQIGQNMAEQRNVDKQKLQDFSLLKMLTPEITESYRGKDIRFPNLGMGPDALGALLNMLDPTGMVGGPAGFVYNTSAQTSPQLLKMLDTIKKVGTTAEEIAPRMKAVTQKMPVNLLHSIPDDPNLFASYLGPSPLRPLGTANLYKPDATAILHEGAGHGLSALDPTVKDLIYDLYMKSPVGTELALDKLKVPTNLYREEFGARLIEDTLAEHVGKKLGMSLPSGPIPFTTEAKEEMWKFLQSPSTKSTVTKSTSQTLAKMKAPKTSDTLKQLYQDITDLSSEVHPLRNKLETDPFARVKFYKELQTKANNLADSHQKKEAIKFLKNISDPKSADASTDLELAAEWIHSGLRSAVPKQEFLLRSEFGTEDADKIIYRLWNNVLNPTEEGKVKLLKAEMPKGRAVTKEQKDIAKSKEIQDVIREEIGKYIQKPGKGGTITSKKGGGMISTEKDKLSTYLEDMLQPTEINKLGRKWEF